MQGSIKLFIIRQLTIGSYVSVPSLRYEACGKFGEHERCVRVARGVVESNSSFLLVQLNLIAQIY